MISSGTIGLNSKVSRHLKELNLVKESRFQDLDYSSGEHLSTFCKVRTLLN